MKIFYLITLLISISLSANAANIASTPVSTPSTKEIASHGVSNSKVKHTTASATVSEAITVNVPCVIGSACYVVTDTSKRVLEVVNKGASPKQTTALIQAVIIPQFDFTLMTKYALGNNWKQATPEQQTQLVELFKQLLIYTYSSVLSKFQNATITVTKVTGGGITDKKATVISEIILNNPSKVSQAVLVEYDLARNPLTAPWKAYDIKIENASLVTTYRNQFNEVVQNGSINTLIQQLKTKVDSLKGVNVS